MAKQICNGCGGVVGRDCFNPQECEWISRQMDRDDVERQLRDESYKRQEKDYYAAMERDHHESMACDTSPEFKTLFDKRKQLQDELKLVSEQIEEYLLTGKIKK